jgi:sterol 14alpha-demethylase
MAVSLPFRYVSIFDSILDAWCADGFLSSLLAHVFLSFSSCRLYFFLFVLLRTCIITPTPTFIITQQLCHKRLTFLIGVEEQEILFKASDDVLSTNQVYDFMKSVFGPHVVYDATKKNRTVQFQTMAKGLHSSRMKAYVAKIEEEARLYFSQHWNTSSNKVDLLTAFSELTILTASRCLHGDDVRTHMFKELHTLYHDLDAGLTPYTPFWSTAPTLAHRRRDAARLEMVKLFGKVIAERRAAAADPNGAGATGDKTDILSLFMEIKYKDGTAISDEQVTGLLIALLFAGQHTSCITTTWTAFYIITHPEIYHRVLAEQTAVLGDRTKLTYDDLQKMELLHNCIREALRLCPTFIIIQRLAEQDITVQSKGQTYFIPKGDIVAVSPTVSMRLASTFPNPNVFDPDRFAPPREEHKIPYGYMGFGGGIHSCMGQAFGFCQIKTILSVMLREYQLHAPQGVPAIEYDAIVVGPKGDTTVTYTKKTTTK